MKPELLIWDWNGTILDDAGVCRQIADIMLGERGIPTLPDMDAYRAVFGFPIKSYYEKMGYRFGPEDEPYEHVADEFIVLYDRLYRTAALRPGIVDFLDRRKGEGYRQVLLSATRRDQLLEQVAAFGDVGDRFEQKLGLTDHYAFSKAALAKAFIEGQGIPRERTLFIGDTDHDFEVSSAIGCPCVLLEGGHQSRERLLKMGVPVLRDLSALESYLNSL
ncbi:MAG: HAD family hydrolase [Clostridia bacterium]|nr:HAD family hydrolase [Clostridia bacterium]